MLRYRLAENMRNVRTALLIACCVLAVFSLLLLALAGPASLPLILVVGAMVLSLGAANALWFLVLRPYWRELSLFRRWGVSALTALVHVAPMFGLFFLAAGWPILALAPIVAIWTAVIYFQTKFWFERKSDGR